MAQQIFYLSDILHRALDYHVERHNILSSNIANIDTPGFRPFELVRETDNSLNGTLALTQSNERHLLRNGSEIGQGEEKLVTEDTSVAAGADGNSVSLEREASKLAANDVRYQGASTLLSRHLAMLRYAASDTNK
jgi:flagellar basal-body rod protein FlgB